MLFVAGGWYQQEDDIETHLLDLGHDVTVKADYQVYGSTDLSIYDLVVITEFAPNLSYSALDNQGNPSSPWNYYWKAPLHEPWGHDFSTPSPHDTNTSGYGPYIIDAYSGDTYPGDAGGDIELWHTISVWGAGPYGVYSGKEVI
ncbi:MAG: hypothetical protein R6V85_04510, partial [Polyangia bacterium]